MALAQLQLHGPFHGVLLLILLTGVADGGGVVPKAEDILKVEEVTIIQLKSVWNLTHATYSLYGTNTTGRIRNFWNNLKSMLAVATDLIRGMERKIVESQPSKLLNKLFNLQDLEGLRELSDTPTNDTVTHWKVKWIEVSSLATHIHWLFNKRVRDIMNNVPYIKTIANSLAKYYGNPWYSKISGRTNDAHRYPMRDYPRWIDNRTFALPNADLFKGLRKLIDDCKICKTGSSVRKDACLGKELLEMIEPLRLDAPVHVFLYLCLVDIKFYILKNFFHIYREAYENIPYTNYSIFDDRLQTRIRKKLEAYSNSFGNYDGHEQQLPKVTKGYFHCDPPPIMPHSNTRGHVYMKTFIKLTNFATDFVVLEQELTPLGSCSSTCKEIGRADREPCTKPKEKCMAEAYPECKDNPKLCENFKPLCLLQDLSCYKSATSAKVCPSKVPERLMEWTQLNNTAIYPKGESPKCEEEVLHFKATTSKDPSTGKVDICEVCLCQCLEPIEIRGKINTVRVFSQKESLALTAENRVVVGIKFEQVDDQIHLMVADAVLLPGMMVSPSTVVWRRPEKADPSNPAQVARISRNLRAIHIDDWKAPPGHVVTGIRFVSKSIGTLGKADYQPYIGIKLQVRRVDEGTGKLVEGEGDWLMNSLAGAKSSYRYSNPDDPLNAEGPALPDSSSNQLIYFRTTAITKTSVNDVIPFFDAQEVIQSRNPSPLRGIGIYHKVKSGHGGFLGFKIIPY